MRLLRADPLSLILFTKPPVAALLLLPRYGVAVQDFAGSWKSGLAFLAVIKAIDPSLVDMKQALEDSMRENLEKAFSIAHDALHIPRLLEPEGSGGSLSLSFFRMIFVTCVTHAVQAENLENTEKSNEDFLYLLYSYH